MKSNFAYVSILSTDNYIVGLMVMYFSNVTKPKYDFFCLVTPNIREENIRILKHLGINLIHVDPIANPYNSDKKSRKYYNYSKLNIFNLTEFKKAVYLDADMIIMHNIDELFNKPHMSGVNSGGMLPDKKSWTKLNSGLMVFEPSNELFNKMVNDIGKIEKEKGKGDQSFLHEFYKNWPNEKKLHLNHTYNIFHIHLDSYARKFNYRLEEKIRYDNEQDDTLVKIIHYIGEDKPWYRIKKLKNNKTIKTLEDKANRIWYKKYRMFKNNILKKLLEDLYSKQSNNIELINEENSEKEKPEEENKEIKQTIPSQVKSEPKNDQTELLEKSNDKDNEISHLEKL